MKSHIQRLSAISNKRSRHIIGLMSGTSLDGLDVVLCTFRGVGLKTRVEVAHFETLAYDDVFKFEIRRVFAQKTIDFQHLTLLNVIIAERHAALVNQCLAKWKIDPSEVDLIASHGQTVFHAPRVLHGLVDRPNATLQLGDGDHIARRTGIITVSDFRQKHLAAGGAGAPLALYGDYYLFSKPGEARFLLNIGGIANYTYLPADGDPSMVFATDTGPGNTLLDAFAREYFDVPYDENARFAAAGRVDIALLEQLKSASFFGSPFPKTTGPEMFSPAWVKAAISQMATEAPTKLDILATLAQLTADTIAEAIQRAPTALHRPVVGKTRLYVSGGGAHNPLILKLLREKLPELPIAPMEKIGINGDAKEAILFAALANETVAGSTTADLNLGGVPLIGMGKISFPG